MVIMGWTTGWMPSQTFALPFEKRASQFCLRLGADKTLIDPCENKARAIGADYDPDLCYLFRRAR